MIEDLTFHNREYQQQVENMQKQQEYWKKKYEIANVSESDQERKEKIKRLINKYENEGYKLEDLFRLIRTTFNLEEVSCLLKSRATPLKCSVNLGSDRKELFTIEKTDENFIYEYDEERLKSIIKNTHLENQEAVRQILKKFDIDGKVKENF